MDRLVNNEDQVSLIAVGLLYERRGTLRRLSRRFRCASHVRRFPLDHVVSFSISSLKLKKQVLTLISSKYL